MNLLSTGKKIFVKMLPGDLRFIISKPDLYGHLNKIGHELGKVVLKQGNDYPQRILFTSSFSIYQPSFAIDKLLSYGLRSRGVNVISVYCDSIQSGECNIFGGVWAGGNNFKQNCNKCINSSKELWNDNPIEALKLSSYLEVSSENTVKTEVNKLKDDEWLSYEIEGMPLGRWVKDILVNNYAVGDYHLVPNYRELAKSHLCNLLLLKKAYANILDKEKPDRVVSNDSYYGMWAIVEALCAKRKIPFYSHYPVNKDRIAFAKDDASMNLDFRIAWPKFSSEVQFTDIKRKVDKWLGGARNLNIDTVSLQNHQNEKHDFTGFDKEKPTALLPTNVIWDLAALDKQVIFTNMIEWIKETIQWFKHHPQYQLIIKIHPAEQDPVIPETQERVAIALQADGIEIPSNVFLLSPKINITVYKLLPMVKVGLVHTTTVGFEMVAHGLPVITTAKAPYRGFGFTFDPTTIDKYFSLIESFLTAKEKYYDSSKIELAYKFIYFYHFHYFIKLNLFKGGYGEDVKLIAQSASDLLPGKNQQFDYVLDAIINGLPIVSQERWPPES